ncbi:hypothetical protein [Bradyrhizobium diazoefficiens]|uniref:hypothetical protein n=1 Tax=Bradyrhizobium diazoefficiens TaxID=1355477 RepID=UPI00272C82E2|nr:hypothetical protein [Bradyrhizobium diazoefficiens]WLA69194.1 hypothetical protein QNN01_22650 [Bradyrhizobium diazoefficiens]
MLPRAPLAQASGRSRVALRADAQPRSRVAAPLSLIFRRARSQPSQRAIADRDGGVAVLAPRLSFILNLFETLASSPAGASHLGTFVSDGTPSSEPSALAASAKTWTTSIAAIQRAGRLGIATWYVNFVRGRIMSRLDHRSAQPGIRTFFARLAKPARPLRRAAAPDGIGRDGGQRRATLLSRIPGHARGALSSVETFAGAGYATRSRWTPFHPRVDTFEAGIRSVIGNRRGLIETLSVTEKRYREATESGSRAPRASAEEKFRAVTAVTLTYRTTKAESPAPMPPPAARPEPPPRPVIDADRLGREIWQQMGRRLRIERERRGKL